MYRDITLINVFGLRGTLNIDTQPGAQGVSIHSTGRYEDKKVPGNQLLVFPEGQEPQPLSPEELAKAAGRGSSVQVQFGPGERPRAVQQHRRPRKQLRSRASIRITCPPGVEVKLFDCWGTWKVGQSWRMMRGNHRHVTR